MKYISANRILQKDNLFLLIPLFLYLPFIFLGYGPDSDTYEVLRTGNTFIRNFDYIPSRSPGYLVFEVFTFFANRIGGSIATNLTVIFMSLVCLYGFYSLCKALSIPNPKYLVLMVALNPYYWVASTTTMDYVFALGFFFMGVMLLLKKKAPYAGIAFSLAVGSRMTTILLVVFILILLFVLKLITFKEVAISFALTAIFSAIFYIPPLDFVKYRWWKIFRPDLGGTEYWSLYLRVGRFLYKNMALFSLPVCLFFVGMGIYLLKKKVKVETAFLKIIAVSLLVFLAYEVLFFYAPLEPSYLLVILPFVFMTVGIFLQSRKALLALLILIFVSNFAVISFAHPNLANHATSAQYGLWLDPGYLVGETSLRMKVINCADLNCYKNSMPN